MNIIIIPCAKNQGIYKGCEAAPLFLCCCLHMCDVPADRRALLNINRFDRIISVNFLNDDGQKLAAAINQNFRMEVADAHKSGLSCGKYKAFPELQALDPDITAEAV